jgi:peptidoglycan/LPS O-acetylase OafA/YrhL
LNAYHTIGEVAVGRKNNYDVIRFAAAVLVIYQHSYPLGAGSANRDFITWLTNGTWDAGAFGVAIFFVISGFLITQSYERSQNLLLFVKARLLRIYPGLLASILLCAFVLGPLVTTLSVKDYFANPETYQYVKSLFLFHMQWNLPGVFEHNAYKGVVNGSLWTISFEVLCYGIVAVIGIIGLLRYRVLILAIFIFNLLLHLFYPELSPARGLQIFGLQVQQLTDLFTYFSAGMVLYSFRNSIPMNKYFAMLSIIVLYFSANLGIMKDTFIIFGSYLIIYFAYLPIWRLSEFSKYGDFSYGMYIFAFPVQQTITYLNGGKMSATINIIYAFFITLILAICSWHLIEKKALKLKNVTLLTEWVPLGAAVKWKGYYSKYLNLLDSGLRSLNWSKFVVLFLIISIAYGFYNQKPSSITFPYHKNGSIFKGNWLPQSPNEAYRWINKSASIELKKPSTAHELRIEGFVPESFKEISLISIVINDQVVTKEIHPGQAIDVAIPITTAFKTYTIKIEFNNAHIPSNDSEDKRVLSALISKIEFI